MSERRPLSERYPFLWQLSVNKGILVRNIQDLVSKETISRTRQEEPLPYVVASYSVPMMKKGPGIDPVTQENKAVNVHIASSKLTGMIIHPGETFSFWKTVGSISRKKGYREGRVIKDNRLIVDVGGGLCNLANVICNAVLRSPLTITEFHQHSDALACDLDHRIPMANGTSVAYNYVDYRFKNETDADFQLVIICPDDTLTAELRSTHPFDQTYRITEDDHHFEKEGDTYYRISKIYKEVCDADGYLLNRELIWNNHSKVMFDPSMIPEDMIHTSEK
ncbi:VanW family protein [uncultured Allobaculum sp.]|uniref:VanW family protein n=1 Tax=uncultured Allobaculum sp. TaxID=1187017 RepID=UPI002591FBF5|nr:VanW family protein [uncultured Allobaculum sp.]